MYLPDSPLIVIRSNDICFTGIIRGCAAASIPVISITFDWDGAPDWLSEDSVHLGEHYEIANPYTDADLASEQFLLILRRISQRYSHKLMVLPSSDTSLMFLQDYHAIFSPYILFMGSADFQKPRFDITHKASCALLLSSSAPELVPKTLHCDSFDKVEAVVEQMIYPAIYKPAVKDYGQTFYALHNGLKAIECKDKKSLKRALVKEIAAGFDLVVQEKIFFENTYDEIPFYLYADAKGNIRMAANGIKEVIEPYPYGTAIVLKFGWFPELLDLANRVVTATGYRGILMIEFVKDKKDGLWKVIELNTRHWLFNGFYQQLGLNYTQILNNDLCNRLPANTTSPIIINNELYEKNPIHIELADLAKKLFVENNLSTMGDLFDYMDSLDGKLSSTYFDFSDSEPGLKQIKKITDTYGWNFNVFKANLLSRLVNYQELPMK
jgi:predicted ATP-grasp superfamily ATP-dependent carboligase